MKSILTNLHRKLDALDALAEVMPTIHCNLVLDTTSEAPSITIFADGHRSAIDALGADGWNRAGANNKYFHHEKIVCGVIVRLHNAEEIVRAYPLAANVPPDFWAEATIPAHTV